MDEGRTRRPPGALFLVSKKMLRFKRTPAPVAKAAYAVTEAYKSALELPKPRSTSTLTSTAIVVNLPRDFPKCTLRNVTLMHASQYAPASYAGPVEAPPSLAYEDYTVTYVFFMRHCFSCSNKRKKIFQIQAGVQNPFCDFAGISQPYQTTQKLIEELPSINAHLQSLGLPRIVEKFQVGSSLLLRAMQTAAIAAACLRKNVECAETIWRVPHVMEVANFYDRLTGLPGVRSFVRSSQNAIDDATSRIDANVLNEHLKSGIDAGDCQPVTCKTGKYIVTTPAAQQAEFISKVVPKLMNSTQGVSLIVSHGKAMRMGYFQGVVMQERGKALNPSPANTETILCAFFHKKEKKEECPLVLVCGRVTPAPVTIPTSDYDVGHKCQKTIQYSMPDPVLAQLKQRVAKAQSTVA
jgi:hypothetical protein